MDFLIDFETKELSIDKFIINFNTKFIKIGEDKLKYFQPHWFLNLTTGSYQYYKNNPIRSKDILKPDFTVTIEQVAIEIQRLRISLYEYLEMCERAISQCKQI